MKKTFAAALAASLALNAASAALFIAAAGSKPQSFAFRAQDPDRPVAAARIVSLPSERAVSFGATELSLRPGESASLRFSLFSGGAQLNFAFEPLYDHDVVAVERSGFGLVIRARAPGSCLLQSVTAEGIRNLAAVTVTE